MCINGWLPNYIHNQKEKTDRETKRQKTAPFPTGRGWRRIPVWVYVDNSGVSTSPWSKIQKGARSVPWSTKPGASMSASMKSGTSWGTPRIPTSRMTRVTSTPSVATTAHNSFFQRRIANVLRVKSLSPCILSRLKNDLSKKKATEQRQSFSLKSAFRVSAAYD